MLKKLLASAVLAASALSLTGCDVFYPHPSESPLPTQSQSPSPTESPSESESPSPSPSQTPVRQKVSVRILQSSADSSSGNITVIAEAADISEDGGSCTLTVVQGSVTKQVTAKAESNVTDTQCYPLNLPLAGFSSGAATFTVQYDSPDSTGSASNNPIVIP